MADPIELSRHCIPWTPFRGKLEEAVVCLVSSAGVRARDDPPFNADGDTSYRVIAGERSGADLAYDDTHYDHACADADINCIFPLDRLRELAEAGRIAGVAKRHFSYGFTMKLRDLRENTFPKLVKEIESVHPDVVVLTGGWGLCHRTVVTAQRLIELRGFSTVAITVSPEETAQANPPRALHPAALPPGHSLGRPRDAALQKRILLDALDLVVHPVEPGKIVTREYR